jgi:transglutaminase-like putative cysteine protease
MRFSVGCELSYAVKAPTTFVLNVEARNSRQQRVSSEVFRITPSGISPPLEVHSDSVYRRFVLPVGEHVLRYEAIVELSPQMHEPASVNEIPIADLPLAVLPYLYPSRYCQSDRLVRFAWRQFGGTARGHERVTAVCNWIYENVDYLPGSSALETSAFETFSTRAGVCRDFAHLGITFCRALGIPARFVSAYGWQLQPQDFHAVFEAYLGGRWYLFDASRMCPLDAIVRISSGHDAADTAFATFYGEIADAPKRVWIEPLGEYSASAQWTLAAVSLTAD